MENAEGADDRVKARRIERVVFGIALAKFEPPVAAARLSDHVRREIDADRVRATRSGAVGNVARSAGHIEDAHASANASGIKQRRDGADRDLASKCIVIVGLGAPALLLKFLKARCVCYSALRHRVVSHLEESVSCTRTPRPATPLRRRAWLRIFVVRYGLPCDPPVGVHSCNGQMIPRFHRTVSDYGPTGPGMACYASAGQSRCRLSN